MCSTIVKSLVLTSFLLVLALLAFPQSLVLIPPCDATVAARVPNITAFPFDDLLQLRPEAGVA